MSMVEPKDPAGLAERLVLLEEELRRVNERLERSECDQRRARRVGLGGLLVTTLIVGAGAAQLGNRFPRLDVVGPNNDVRVATSVNPENGSAGIEVFGLNGRRVIFLGTSAEGTPNLAIYDPAGQAVVRSFTP